MVDLPVTLTTPLWSFTQRSSAATVLRIWSAQYGAQHQFNTVANPENVVQDAFRHVFVGAAFYIEAYRSQVDLGASHVQADQYATNYVLRLGNFNETMATNTLPNHLRDYWHNYEGAATGRDVVLNVGTNISNNDLAQEVANQINLARAAPSTSNIIFYVGAGPTRATDPISGFQYQGIDPRLSPQNFDLQRLPNSTWYSSGS